MGFTTYHEFNCSLMRGCPIDYWLIHEPSSKLTIEIVFRTELMKVSCQQPRTPASCGHRPRRTASRAFTNKVVEGGLCEADCFSDPIVRLPSPKLISSRTPGESHDAKRRLRTNHRPRHLKVNSWTHNLQPARLDPDATSAVILLRLFRSPSSTLLFEVLSFLEYRCGRKSAHILNVNN